MACIARALGARGFAWDEWPREVSWSVGAGWDGGRDGGGNVGPMPGGAPGRWVSGPCSGAPCRGTR